MPISGTTIESTQLAFTTGGAADVNFRQGEVSIRVRRLVLSCDADVYINFDEAADNTCFVLTPGCGQISIDNITFTTLSALGVNAGGTLYILAMRD
jgi:hypothetical protein